jgi:hypothetical protein
MVWTALLALMGLMRLEELKSRHHVLMKEFRSYGISKRGHFEHGNELSGFIKDGEFLD